jgi:hypothetical protein
VCTVSVVNCALVPPHSPLALTKSHAPLPPPYSCTAATAGLTASGSYYRVTTNAQLLGLSKCTFIDYLLIWGCADCTQAAWCGLQPLQSITGEDPTYGQSLNPYHTPGISDRCGLKTVAGALTGGFGMRTMDGLVGLDGAEGIAIVWG